MLKRLTPICALICVACATTQPSPARNPRQIRIYDARVLQSEYGTAIDDPNCPTGGLPVTIDPVLEGSEFLKVLRHGGGRLGPADKYVIVDGIVQTSGELGDGTELRLVRVDSLREQIFNPNHYMELSEAKLGCEKDAVRKRAWLQSLQRNSRRR